MKHFAGHVFAALFSIAAASAADSQQPNRIYVDAAMRSDGSPSRGRTLFFDEQKTACSKCHSVDQTAGKAGPNLAAVGEKFPRRELVRAVLEPSTSIAIGYDTTLIETKDGEEYQGIVKQASETETVLIDASGATVRARNADISSQRVSTLSLMPEGLESGMTPGEFADLIAYLESLREPANAVASSLGNPATIPMCAEPVSLRPFFGENIRFNEPVWFGFIPGTTNKSAVLEHAGRSWILEHTAAGDTRSELVDLSGVVRLGGATGLLGLAFHPKFAENGRYFLKYHILDERRITTIVCERRFDLKRMGDSGEPSRELMRIPGATQDHHGGCLTFGPDGFLYIGTGDSGPQQDPQGHGQAMTTLLGKMLRIDVDRAGEGKPYGIPMDNPFRTNITSLPEIWACGFREPWRFTFDRATGDLWVGDVGQDRYEEVSIARAGENHGWNVYEGFAPFSTRFRREGERYVAPIFGYSHRHGVSVTGGYVYRGKRAPGMYGQYICADFETRRIWALTQTNRVLSSLVEIGRAPTRVASFTEDAEGELYLVGFDAGTIFRMDLSTVDLTPLESRAIAATSEAAPVEWKYSVAQPAANWIEPAYDDSTWRSSAGGFGTAGTPGATIRTEWRSKDIWLRRKFIISASELKNRASLLLRAHHDEDAEVYLNGTEAARLPRWTQGYIDMSPSAAAVDTLHPGTNVISVHCRQVSGGQYIDVGLIQRARSESGAAARR